MALIDKASLLFVPSVVAQEKAFNILPSGNRAPDSTGENSGYDQTRADFDFDRGSNAAATRVNASGLIEKYRENLLLQSNQFDTTWLQTNTTLTSGQSGYNGNDAWKVASASGGQTGMQQNISFSNIHTFSIYAKAGSVDFLKLFVVQSGTNRNCVIDLSDGSIASEVKANSSPEASVTSLANGWYRIEMPTNANSATFVRIRPHLSVSDENLSVGDFIYIQSAQLESGLVASSYLDSTSVTGKAGVLVDLPRINYDANGENGALLLEPSRSNSIIYSEYTDGSNWSNEGSITDEENTSETTSPEGLYNAVKLVSANATSEQWIQTTGVQTTNATDCTISCFVKKSDYDYFHIRFTGINGAFAAGSVWFNIADGSVGTKQIGISADIKDYGNGWYRISATKEATATTTAGIRFQLASSNNDYNVVGDGVKGTYIYGAQAEIGSYVSSYIPTMGTSETRAADSCSVTGASDVIGQSEGTLFWEGSIVSVSSQGANIASFNYSTSSSISLERQSNGTIRARIWNGGAIVNIVTSGSNYNGNVKIAFAYKSGDTTLYIDGLQIGTSSTAFSFGLSLTEFNLGAGDVYFAYPHKSEVKQATLFKERLSNTELATLTTL